MNGIERLFRAAALAGGVGLVSAGAWATEPCGDFGACKALIEINASDGDIGFHFLLGGDDLRAARVRNANGKKVFDDKAKGPLKEQYLSETFVESAEPVCRPELAEDEEETVVTLEEFLERWPAGAYVFEGKGADGKVEGESPLTHELPAAPANVDFDPTTGEISWADTGNDLGECATNAELTALVANGTLPTHPADVPVREWEAVFAPDVEDGDPLGNLTFSVRVPATQLSVTVPGELLAGLPNDTPAKVEVGAIGLEDNATFTEEDGFCVNEAAGCGP